MDTEGKQQNILGGRGGRGRRGRFSLQSRTKFLTRASTKII